MYYALYGISTCKRVLKRMCLIKRHMKVHENITATTTVRGAQRCHICAREYKSLAGLTATFALLTFEDKLSDISRNRVATYTEVRYGLVHRYWFLIFFQCCFYC